MQSTANVPAVFELARSAAPAAVRRVLSSDDTTALLAVSTTAGDSDLAALVARFEADAASLAGSRLDLVVTSDALVIEETNEALTASQGRTIVYALAAATLLLVMHFWIAVRRPVLGLLTMVSTALTVAWILGTMHLLGLSFNVLTVTIAAVAVGIGVDYAIHMTHRFTEESTRWASLDDAIGAAVTHTGSALAISAATTAIGFGVLTLSGIEPIRQFGAITALTIVYAFLAAVLVQPAVLHLWAVWRRRSEGRSGSPTRQAADRAEG
jgi:predicted RND superfamily exporter protein